MLIVQRARLLTGDDLEEPGGGMQRCLQFVQALGQAVGRGMLEHGQTIAGLLVFGGATQQQGGPLGEWRQHLGRAARKGIWPPGGQAEHAEQVAPAGQGHADERADLGIRQGDVALILAYILDLGWPASRGHPASDAEANGKMRSDWGAGRHHRRHGDDFAVADKTQGPLIRADQTTGDAHDAVGYGRLGRCFERQTGE